MVIKAVSLLLTRRSVDATPSGESGFQFLNCYGCFVNGDAFYSFSLEFRSSHDFAVAFCDGTADFMGKITVEIREAFPIIVGTTMAFRLGYSQLLVLT